jgi:predicted nucleotidyltransferase
MRLSNTEITAIKSTIAGLDPCAQIYLFGSRVDDTKRGGDIDLLIMSENLSADDRNKIRWQLWERIGEQKIDILIAKDTTDPFVRLARSKGTEL